MQVAGELPREAFEVRGACSRFRITPALRQRQQAGRTPNASRGSSSAKAVARFSNQIVIGVADDLHLRELAKGQLAAHIDPAIDVRRVGFAAGDLEAALELGRMLFRAPDEAVFPGANASALEFIRAGRLLDQHFDSAPNEQSGPLHRDFMLSRHCQAAPLLFDLVWNLAGHAPRARAFFLRISEHAQSLEPRLPNEPEQVLKVGLCLTGETDDERGAQRDAGNALSNAANEVHDILAGSLATHPLEHVLVNVLKGNINIARDLWALGNGANQLIRPMRRMRVEQTEPELTGQGIQLVQQGANGGGLGWERLHRCVELRGRGNRSAAVRAQVQTVVSRVLRDQVQFLDAVGNQRLGVRDQVRLRTAAVGPSHARNDAEAARMIASFRDLEVGEMARRQPEARGRVVGDVVGAEVDGDERGERDWGVACCVLRGRGKNILCLPNLPGLAQFVALRRSPGPIKLIQAPEDSSARTSAPGLWTLDFRL